MGVAEPSSVMDVDEVYSHIGGFGPMQKRFVLALALSQFYLAQVNLNLEFTAFTPDFDCHLGNGSAPLRNECPDNRAARCSHFTYLSNYTTLATEWDLVCDAAYRARGSQSVFMTGLMVAAPLMGPLADRLGRRRTLAGCCLALVACLGGSMAAPSHDVFVLLRFLSGCVAIGFVLSSFVLISEIVGVAQRADCGTLSNFAFALGIPLLSMLAWAIHSWRQMYLAMMIFGSLYLVVIWYVPESPRWLLLTGRHEAALRVLQRIARGNGVALPAGLRLRSAAPRSGAPAEGVTSLFKYRKVAVWTMVMILSWFTNNLCYYGLTSASATMGSDRFTSVALSGLVEIPAYVALFLLLNRLGRRLPVVGFMLVGGACCLCIVGLPQGGDLSHLRMILGLTGKLCAAASFSAIFVHSGEIFPTSIRNTGFGLVNIAARLGGIVYPFMGMLNSILPDLDFAAFGALAVVSGLLNLSLPETLGRPLPDTVEQLAGASSAQEMYTPLRSEEPAESSDEDAEAGVVKRRSPKLLH